jgi:hypothetical protein
MDPWTGAVDSVHRAVDTIYTFSYTKIICLFQKFAGAMQFCKNTLGLFQNYVLVLLFFHLGPYLSFYNYDLVLALINLIYFNYLHSFLTIALI